MTELAHSGAGALKTGDLIERLVAVRAEVLATVARLEASEKDLANLYDSIGGYPSVRLRQDYGVTGNLAPQKHIDQAIWRHLVRAFELQKFMLATEWQSLQQEIDGFRTPEFNEANASVWIAGLKGLIYDNVVTLVHQVFETITQGHYYVGGGYGATKKKRNNNGVDKRFILRTGDELSMGYYHRLSPTQTDDLEKVNYILDGKALPEVTIKQRMNQEKVRTASDAYMTIEICKNGNTHYTLTDEARNRLNRFGPKGSVIGEAIKIKVFE